MNHDTHPSSPAGLSARERIAVQQQWLAQAMNSGFDQWAKRQKHHRTLVRYYALTLCIAAVVSASVAAAIPTPAPINYRLGKNADHQQTIAIIKNNLTYLS